MIDAILPFTGINFFILTFIFVSFIHLFKNILSKFIAFDMLIFLSTVIYMVVCIPASYKILIFLIYVYSVYLLFIKIKYQKLVLPMIVIALPMILNKIDINPLFKLIGISYITFRTIQAMVDSQNYGKLTFIQFTSFLLLPTTILAGPIDRSYRFQEDLKNGYENLTLGNIGKGWDILLLEYFLNLW